MVVITSTAWLFFYLLLLLLISPAVEWFARWVRALLMADKQPNLLSLYKRLVNMAGSYTPQSLKAPYGGIFPPFFLALVITAGLMCPLCIGSQTGSIGEITAFVGLISLGLIMFIPVGFAYRRSFKEILGSLEIRQAIVGDAIFLLGILVYSLRNLGSHFHSIDNLGFCISSLLAILVMLWGIRSLAGKLPFPLYGSPPPAEISLVSNYNPHGQGLLALAFYLKNCLYYSLVLTALVNEIAMQLRELELTFCPLAGITLQIPSMFVLAGILSAISALLWSKEVKITWTHHSIILASGVLAAILRMIGV